MKTLTAAPTTGLTGSMLINSLLEQTVPYTDRSNARKGLLRFAGKHQIDPEQLTVTGDGSSFKITLRPQLIAAPAGEDLKATLPNSHPKFLDRIGDKTAAEIDAERQRLNTAARRQRAIKNPRGTIKNPRTKSKPTGLGMAPTEMRKAGAAVKGEGGGKKGRRGKGQAALNEVARGQRAPREGGKGAAVITMLRARWTPMSAIVEATGWEKHTARAFISRLRSKDKLVVESEKKGEEQHYRIV